LLRCKGLICWRQWPLAPWLGTAKAKDRVVGLLCTAAPLHSWLDQQVGPALPDQPGPAALAGLVRKMCDARCGG
jgi:hypothetical protein